MTIRMNQRIAMSLCCFLILITGSLQAADSVPEKTLPLDGRITEEGTRIELEWPRASGSGFDPEVVQRRILGMTGNSSWQTITTTRRNASGYEDRDVQPGIAYEYRVSRYGSQLVETGYWTAGSLLPAEESRGQALLVVDETLADPLSGHLNRFTLDLIGDGWSVARLDAPRQVTNNAREKLVAARNIQSWIREQYASDAGTPHTLVLIGHLPVIKSGRLNPDGHSARALETDLFYADIDGVWMDDGKGVLPHNTIPGDHIEMPVGRIDFSGMDTALGDEITLLKNYFDKNHNWRHGRLGDLRQAYGGHEMLFVENGALRNIVGPDNVVTGGHHDAGTQQAWLFGVDFGNYSYASYTTPASINAVFSINFGSGKLEFSKSNNTMKAMLAQPWFGLTTGWGGRPSWQLHHMALGKPVGYSHMRTVNNGSLTQGVTDTLEYTPTGIYTWVNPVWVNLLGDPTLHAFPLQPVSNLRAESSAAGVQLEWESADPDIQYRVYRAQERYGPYQPLNSALIDETRYLDTEPENGVWYMVRTHALKEVYAGSFFTFSQGAYVTPDNTAPEATDQLHSATAGMEIPVHMAASDADSDNELVMAFIRGPEKGDLAQVNGEWIYYPDADFSGRVNIPFTVFDGVASDHGLISVEITIAEEAQPQEPDSAGLP